MGSLEKGPAQDTSRGRSCPGERQRDLIQVTPGPGGAAVSCTSASCPDIQHPPSLDSATYFSAPLFPLVLNVLPPQRASF